MQILLPWIEHDRDYLFSRLILWMDKKNNELPIKMVVIIII